jgi:hypothetical protein
VRELQASLYAHDLLIRSLRAQIARLKKQKFGASSEKIAREIEQLELTLEGLEIAKAETSDEPASETDTAPPDAPVDDAGAERHKRRRPRVPPDTPRDRHEFDPGETCPDCGGALRLVGDTTAFQFRCIPPLALVRLHLRLVGRVGCSPARCRVTSCR